MSKQDRGRYTRTLRTAVLGLVLVLSFCPPAAKAQKESIPATQGRTLSGTAVSLPMDAHGRPFVLIFGFQRSAKEQTTVWGKELLAWQQQGLAFDFYQVPMLSAAPRFTHGMITRAMKSSMPALFKPHTLILSSNEDAWRAVIRPVNKDDVYVVLCDHTGQITWRTTGAEPAQMRVLRGKLG